MDTENALKYCNKNIIKMLLCRMWCVHWKASNHSL